MKFICFAYNDNQSFFYLKNNIYKYYLLIIKIILLLLFVFITEYGRVNE